MITLPVITKNKLTVETTPNYVEYVKLLVEIIKVIQRIIRKPFSIFSYGQGATDLYHVAMTTTDNTVKFIAEKSSSLLGWIALGKSFVK